MIRISCPKLMAPMYMRLGALASRRHDEDEVWRRRQWLTTTASGTRKMVALGSRLRGNDEGEVRERRGGGAGTTREGAGTMVGGAGTTRKWRRGWKIRLIEQLNPEWDDLYDEIG